MAGTAGATPEPEVHERSSDPLLLPGLLALSSCLVGWWLTRMAGSAGAGLGGLFVAGALGLGGAIFFDARSPASSRWSGAAALLVVGAWSLLCSRLTQLQEQARGWGASLAPGLDLLLKPGQIAGGAGYALVLALVITTIALAARTRFARRLALAGAYAAIGPICMWTILLVSSQPEIGASLLLTGRYP